MKKLITLFLCITVICSSVVSASETEDAIAEASGYILQNVTSPTINSAGGEWSVIALARSSGSIPGEFYAKYLNNLKNILKEQNGSLSNTKNTEYARVILALTALGYDAQSFEGYNLTSALWDFDKTVAQGINGAIWALIALDSNPEYGNNEIKQNYIDFILGKELKEGGFSLSGNTADADVTAMALVALAKYHTDLNVDTTITKALQTLSAMQNSDGGFSNFGNSNSESTAQVITALCTLGISMEDERFVKNSNTLRDNLMTYRLPNGSFCHTAGGSVNLMATEQALYAMVALQRCESEKLPLFDMKDAARAEEPVSDTAAFENFPVLYPSKSFSDISKHPNREAIEALAQRGIIYGMPDGTFCPDSTVTRAEFTAIITRALKISTEGKSTFDDVNETDWFYPYVNAAYENGIVKGISDKRFNPLGNITKEEAAVMIARASALCGIYTGTELFEAKNILAEFGDYVKVSDWALTSVAFCYKLEILDRSEFEITPQKNASRGEISQMVKNMLSEANLI